MPDPEPNLELLRSLGRLIRGLSALFWGLPLALVVCAETARTGWLRGFTVVPPLLATGLLLFGLRELGSFQKQERPWRAALDRTRFFALINCGLSPFLYWWNRLPDHPFFQAAVDVLILSALLFLLYLNSVVQRLGEMLPEETLRTETRHYTALNRYLLAALLGLAAVYLLVSRILQSWLWPDNHPKYLELLSQPLVISALGLEFNGLWLIWFALCLLVLLPVATTMALIWKTKEIIIDGVFGGK